MARKILPITIPSIVGTVLPGSVEFMSVSVKVTLNCDAAGLCDRAGDWVGTFG